MKKFIFILTLVYSPLTLSSTTTDALIVGTGVSTGSVHPLEIIGENAGLAITSTGTASGTESYIAAFLKNSAGIYIKSGATAHLITDGNITNGYASWNVHNTYYNNGVSYDNYGLAVWAKHGARFFPTSLGPESAPGDKVLLISGDLKVENSIDLMSNNTAVVGRSVAGIPLNLIHTDNANNGHIIIGHNADYPAGIVQAPSTDINVASSAMDGGLVWDSTNHWIVGYIGGQRYKFVGVAY